MVPNGWEVVPIWHPLGFKQKSSVWMGFGPPTPVQCQVGQMMIQPSRILFKLGGKRTANYWKLSSSLARRTTKQHVIRQCRPREHRRNMFCWEILRSKCRFWKSKLPSRKFESVTLSLLRSFEISASWTPEFIWMMLSLCGEHGRRRIHDVVLLYQKASRSHKIS